MRETLLLTFNLRYLINQSHMDFYRDSLNVNYPNCSAPLDTSLPKSISSMILKDWDFAKYSLHLKNPLLSNWTTDILGQTLFYCGEGAVLCGMGYVAAF